MKNAKALPEIWRGKWALVTGASSGIGRAIAEKLAASGAHLVLTARRADRLHELRDALESRYGIEAHCVPADLCDPQAPHRIFSFTEERNLVIDVLVNNAGLSAYGEFFASQLDRELAMVQVHCHAVVHLTHLYLRGMIERRTGHILMVATTALIPAPYIATYAATKGFDQLFAEGLAEEVARYGVRVSALCPGPTASEMVITTDGDSARSHPSLQSAEEVASLALRGMAQGKPCIRTSVAARITANLPRFLPRATVSGMTERAYHPKGIGQRTRS